LGIIRIKLFIIHQFLNECTDCSTLVERMLHGLCIQHVMVRRKGQSTSGSLNSFTISRKYDSVFTGTPTVGGVVGNH